MIEKPMDVLTFFPVRKSGKQKQAFRDEIQSYAASLGYETTIEKGSFGSKNIIIGNPDSAEYLITAHYDTPAGLPFPNLITPCNFVPFLGYQLFVTAMIFIFVFVIGFSAAFLLSNNEAVIFLIAYASIWFVLAMMMVGPANKNNANDNTSGVVTVLETAASMPEEYRGKVCFVLFDLEEAGLIGSSSYRKKHKKQSDRQVILNLDCVGEGSEILLFPTRGMKKDKEKMGRLSRICGPADQRNVSVRTRGFAYYPSDQAQFPCGVGICALKKSMFGLYLGRIHTKRDTILDEENVSILRNCLIRLVADAAE
ncbi:MAG: M28 family peptidase [Oscillospiraceae bacterium]|nr:M28 family peptidase [Oscillospiraceae bacterium]